MESKIIAAKEIYHESLVTNLKKDIIIGNLEDELKKKKCRYELFRREFGDEIITTLSLMADSKEKDSLFIKTALEHLYRDNLRKLKEKTYSGRTKEAITPKKKELLKKLFDKRVEYLKDEQEKKDRNQTFGKVVKNAIESINKSNSK